MILKFVKNAVSFQWRGFWSAPDIVYF